MADKKDVLDYLRNQQKAAEIEAKMNGVNVWVLLGAIGVVGWQLISVPATKLWSDYELIARTLVATTALYMLSPLAAKSSGERDDLRYSGTNFSEVESPFLMLLMSVLVFLPPAALWLLAGKSVGAIVLSLVGLTFITFSSISILKPLFPQSQTAERFPNPEFGLTRRGNVMTELISGALFIVAFIEQILHTGGMRSSVSIDEIKPIMLLGVLYLLVLITITRKRQNYSIAWTYELETDVVLEIISPEVAIRKIENRRLGHRLQDVVDRFFDDLDQRFTEVDSKLTECNEKISAAKEVPEQYPAERAARVNAASEGLANRIDALAADCAEFREYLTKVEHKSGTRRRVVLAPILASLKVQHKLYEERVRKTRLQLSRLLT